MQPITVIGDYFSDIDVVAGCHKLDDHTGAPVLTNCRMSSRPGGAAAVACMIETLGTPARRVRISGRLGTKTRYFVNDAAICRVDNERTDPISVTEALELLRQVPRDG